LSVNVPPAPVIVIEQAKTVPALVILLAPVELNVIVPVLFQTVPVIKLMLPATASVGEVPVAYVTVPALTVKFLQFSAPVMVTVYVPAWSKNTSSADVGTLAPPAPPLVALQLVVLDVFQVPVPPTQYLSAI
jgi:hypothetical protein